MKRLRGAVRHDAGGDAALDDPQWEKRRWNGAQAYSDSKLDDVLLAFAVARRPYSTQSQNTFAAVISGKIEVPEAEEDSRSQCVNEDQTPHTPEMHIPGFGVRPPDNTFVLPFHPIRGLSFPKCREPGATLLYYNASVKFILREFKREDFGILWDIDQKCFSPGISYSRLELAAYIRRRGSRAAEGRVGPGPSRRGQPVGARADPSGAPGLCERARPAVGL